MPPLPVRLAESAMGDLEALKDWYDAQGVPEVGTRLVTEIFQRIEMLRDHPNLGRIVPEFDQPSLRELIHPPFRIRSGSSIAPARKRCTSFACDAASGCLCSHAMATRDGALRKPHRDK